MPLTLESRYALLRWLDTKYQREYEIHTRNAPRNGDIPIGGGDWMDSFFRLEGIRGMVNGLRSGKSIGDSLEDGVAVGTIAIQLWNTRREWQVHRWEGSVRSYLENLIRLYYSG